MHGCRDARMHGCMDRLKSTRKQGGMFPPMREAECRDEGAGIECVARVPSEVEAAEVEGAGMAGCSERWRLTVEEGVSAPHFAVFRGGPSAAGRAPQL